MQKINDIKIDVLKTKQDKKINLHQNMFHDYYPNILISARKNSGKSNLIYNIIKNIVVPKRLNKIFFFCKTFENDMTYQAMAEKLDKYNIEYQVFDDIKCVDENTGKLKYILNDVMNEMKQGVENDKERFKKTKYSYPLYIIVFDDFSDCLREKKIIENYIKRNRHYRAVSLIAQHQFKDVAPGIRSNINYLILYKNVPLKDLETIYDTYFNNISFERFLEIYNDAVKEPFNFLYINTNDNTDLRKNFNFKYNI